MRRDNFSKLKKRSHIIDGFSENALMKYTEMLTGVISRVD